MGQTADTIYGVNLQVDSSSVPVSSSAEWKQLLSFKRVLNLDPQGEDHM